MLSHQQCNTGAFSFPEWAARALFLPYENKTRLAEAPFGPFGDDNGPGSEPPPRNRIGIAMAFMPSRRRSPAAPGKPSFPYFKADYISTSTTRASKQPRADAPFGRADDDNGPGSEPPPQDRIGLFMAVMPSPRRPPAAVGKPSFPYFKADYLPDDVCRPRRPTIFRHRISATRWRTKDPKAWAQTAGIRRFVPANSRRRRRIPSLSSCCRNNFGRESDHSTYVVARSGKKSPYDTQRMDTQWMDTQRMDDTTTRNGWTRNGWTRNGWTRNEWTRNGWTRNGWTRNGWTRSNCPNTNCPRSASTRSG
ncbi:hypothetical protein THAOC_10810 [Thalassiosira oceanica]|uniref:Uncharacterized protein n=1 Tax=Thalassiosira oceanica TaxID=159749 RepID=K0SRN1_THAOC|nr:hypothetical protein THAOC_10810 [Thalassiosira oceanica]|eukprot:EJK68055.1 hypothetical protein THAOC_10810 [Thalassiosira oceanica]